MGFRHIKFVLADVMADIESERAAVKVAQGIGGGSADEGHANPPIAQQGGRSASKGMGKEAGAVEAPASCAQGVRQASGKPGGKAPNTSLPVGRDMVVARNAEPHRERRAPASATIISLATWRESRHAARL